MSRERTEMYRLQELVRLHRMDTKVREICKNLKMSPKTERKYREILKNLGLLHGPVEELPLLETLKKAVLEVWPEPSQNSVKSTIEAYRSLIVPRVELGLHPTPIYDWLRINEPDFKGSLSAVKRMVKAIRKEKGISAKDVVIIVDTPPGKQAQVDFGYLGKLYNPSTGKTQKVWIFVMVLSFSRKIVVRLTTDQTMETWQKVHQEAFEELGGVPKVIVPDNLKAAVIRGAFGFGDKITLNRSYAELARHYGFKIDPTPVYSPEKKGKVESAVKYIKSSFVAPRNFADLDDAYSQLIPWVTKIADVRVHGTTGKVPQEQFNDYEKKELLKLPDSPYEVTIWSKAKVHRDFHIQFKKRLYSVSWRLVGKEVWVRATSDTVYIYSDDIRVATHPRHFKGPRSTQKAHEPEHRARLKHRSEQYWIDAADQIGEESGIYIREIFESDEVLYQLRTVQAIVTHLEKFPEKRANAACERARYYGNYTYKGIKNILRKGLDMEALPHETDIIHGSIVNPKYTRSPSKPIQLEFKNEQN